MPQKLRVTEQFCNTLVLLIISFSVILGPSDSGVLGLSLRPQKSINRYLDKPSNAVELVTKNSCQKPKPWLYTHEVLGKFHFSKNVIELKHII